MIKNVYQGLTVNLIFMVRTRQFPAEIRNKPACLVSLLLLSIVLEIPANAIKEEKEIKGILIEKK